MDLEKAYNLISTKLSVWMKDLIRILPNLALAALVLVVGFFLSKFIKRLSQKLMKRITHHEAVNNLFVSFIYLLALSITLFVALSILNLDKAVTSILAGAGIIGLALAFAFQDIGANFIAGIFLSFRRPLQIGDLVQTNDILGKVVTINLRDTVIRTLQGQYVIIPNKEIFQNKLMNYTKSGKRRMDMTVGVSYGEDLEKVRRVTIQAVNNVSVRVQDEPVRFFYEVFDDSSINFILQIWINSTEQPIFLQARSEAIMLIKKAYDENEITIPFPIRTLDFGIKGGQTLSEMVVNVDNKNGNGNMRSS
ncbi:mechanosensitive ion channel family protein [Aridibaculum aurantiacum]|uniref:mechanosensitive ion channel family protein n=1 Tax=Aridibaculum aurantiacum TaxID=2810307 RepID=UPI001A971254|nr:mechanosensitive ion channel family protein [Aridibaculum aurantiacum]